MGMTMQMEKQHLGRVRVEVDELKAIVEKEPDARMVSAAYDALSRIVRALGDLAPNHPGILQHRSALAVPLGKSR
jgi:hypothetical protein